MDSIAICAVFQDAAARILEWVAFHRLIGVDRFVLYDLGSTDGTAALLARSRFGHQATVIDWARNDGPAAALADFVANHANRFTWAAIIELDEFLHPIDTDTIRSLLPRYDRFSAVALRRLSFVTSGQQIRPGQLVIGSYTSREPDDPALNDAMPTLVRTGDLQGVGRHAARLRADRHRLRCARRARAGGGDGSAGRRRRDGGEPLSRPAGGGGAIGGGGPISRPTAWRPCRWPPRSPTGRPAPPRREAAVPDRRILRFIPRLRAMLHDASMAAQPRPAPPARSHACAPPRPPGTPVAPLLLGIGIVTYNRRAVLSETLDRVQQHTKHPRTVVAVADDGSTDGTLDMLRARQVLTVTGRNMSIAWNKNRALFLLSELLRCDVVLLLEDDAYPARDHWETEWIHAAVRWGHANVAVRWIEDTCRSRLGAPAPWTIRSTAAGSPPNAPCSRARHCCSAAISTRGSANMATSMSSTRDGCCAWAMAAHWSRSNGQPGPFFKLLWGGIGYPSRAARGRGEGCAGGAEPGAGARARRRFQLPRAVAE